MVEEPVPTCGHAGHFHPPPRQRPTARRPKPLARFAPLHAAERGTRRDLLAVPSATWAPEKDSTRSNQTMNTITHARSNRTLALLTITTGLATVGCQTVDLEPCRQAILDSRDTGNFCPAIGCACAEYLAQGFVLGGCYYHLHPQTGELTQDCACELFDDEPTLSNDSSAIQRRLAQIIQDELGAEGEPDQCGLWRDYCETFLAGYDGQCVIRTDPATGETLEDCTCALLANEDENDAPVLTPINGRVELDR